MMMAQAMQSNTTLQSENIFSRRNVFLLTVIWAVVALLHVVWLKRCGYPPLGDGIVFILRGMRYAYLFQTQDYLLTIKQIIFNQEGAIVSLLDIIFTLYYMIAGIASEMELIITTVFIALGIVGVYGLTARCFNSRAGFVATIIFISMNGVIEYQRLGGYREFYLMCFIVLTCYSLQCTNKFTNLKYSLISGILAGLSIMIKMEAVVWFIYPLLSNLLRVDHGERTIEGVGSRRMRNILSFLGVVALIAGSVYVPQCKQIIGELFQRGNIKGNAQYCFELTRPFYYLRVVFYRKISASLLLFSSVAAGYVICSLPFVGIKGKDLRAILHVGLYGFVPLMFFSCFNCKADAHIIPVLGFVSVLIAGIHGFVRPKVINLFFLLVLIQSILVVHYKAATFNFKKPEDLTGLMKFSVLDRGGAMLVRRSIGSLFGDMTTLEAGVGWDVFLKLLLSNIKEDMARQGSDEQNGHNSIVLLLANNMPLRYFQLCYYSAKMRLPVEIRGSLYEEQFWSETKAQEILYEMNVRYIIDEKIDGGFEYLEGENYGLGRLLDYIYSQEKGSDEFKLYYEIVTTIDSPRGTQITIYRRNDVLYHVPLITG